jgi:hypothetical protein
MDVTQQQLLCLAIHFLSLYIIMFLWLSHPYEFVGSTCPPALGAADMGLVALGSFLSLLPIPTRVSICLTTLSQMIVSKPAIVFHSSQILFNFLAMACFASVASFQAKFGVGPCKQTLVRVFFVYSLLSQLASPGSPSSYLYRASSSHYSCSSYPSYTKSTTNSFALLARSRRYASLSFSPAPE